MRAQIRINILRGELSRARPVNTPVCVVTYYFLFFGRASFTYIICKLLQNTIIIVLWKFFVEMYFHILVDQKSTNGCSKIILLRFTKTTKQTKQWRDWNLTQAEAAAWPKTRHICFYIYVRWYELLITR